MPYHPLPPQRPPGAAEAPQTDNAAAGHDTPGAAPPGSVEFKPGARPVPDYELVQRLGRGGFGEVWKAVGPGSVAVALKFIRLDDKAGAVEQRSLELIRDIRHPNLLALFGSWQRDGFLILALELGEGTLLDRLKQAQAAGTEGIPPGELLDHMRDAARGLDYLNGRGIQHRDVKPHNFLLVGGGVKVADFGLAKLLQHTLTSNTGSLTPAYAAPEFFNGQTSNLSDQYSLAVTYCHLRGGRLPFEGSATELMMGHVIREPDLTMLPESERPVVARALAKKPPERWPSCREFVEALAVGIEDPTPRVPEVHLRTLPDWRVPRRRRTWTALALGLLVLLALPIGVVWWGLTQPPQDTPAGRPEPVAVLQAREAPSAQEPARPDKPAPQGDAAAPPPVDPGPAVPAPPRPPALLHLQPVAAVRLEVGESKPLAIRIGREHCRGPVELRVAGLPPGVTARPGVVPADAEEGQVEVSAAANADNVDGVLVRLEALATEARTEGTFQLTVVRRPAPPRPPVAVLHLQPVAAVRLEAGRSQTVTVRLRRENCTGPVELRVEGLPAGVRPRPGVVPADAEEGHVELTAAADARNADGPVRLVAAAAEVRAERSFRLTVVRRPAELPKALVNSIGMPLVLVPAGKFRMGSPDTDPDRYDDEEPQHEVQITQPFYLGKFAVTRGQFRKFVQATGHRTEAERDGKGAGGYDADKRGFYYPVVGRNWLNTGFEQTDEHPVVNVSWNDAQAFCAWLSQKEGKQYRLPREAEWEHSCRAGTTTRFHSGDEEHSLRRVANIADRSLKAKWNYANLQDEAMHKLITDWFGRVSWDDGYPFTAPVGQFEANAFGLYDMHGNVWQWCEDRYDANYYQNSPLKDPEGPGPDAGSFRVIRGGTFRFLPRDCRAAHRGRVEPTASYFHLGWRVVRVP
jgi:formylglycine-generating enzyme required for sulfatase activity